MKFAWIDLRGVPETQRPAVLDAAVHARLAGIVSDDAALLATLPPTITRILAADPPPKVGDLSPAPKAIDPLPKAGDSSPAPKAIDPLPKASDQPAKGGARAPKDGDRAPKSGDSPPIPKSGDLPLEPGDTATTVSYMSPKGDGEAAYDMVLRTVTDAEGLAVVQASGDGAVVAVTDDPSLRLACAAAVALPHTLVHFADPTKIPLEIVLAAADRSAGQLVTAVADLEEAGIVLDVLERGSDGLMLAPRDAGEVFALARLLTAEAPKLELTTLIVDSIAHHGLGDRVCVDTCSHFAEDEGILVGSFSSGFILCCSETHPLPYMPTRPFRVNAGALHSYVLGEDNRTNYLSELRTGSTVLAVGADGRSRRVVVGRSKLESRPLLTITAHAVDGPVVSLTVQDDWHVRVLGPGGKVRNVTELAAGDELLGYLATDQRHVGYPIGEFCRES